MGMRLDAAVRCVAGWVAAAEPTPMVGALLGGVLLSLGLVGGVLLGGAVIGQTLVVFAVINLIAALGLSVFSSNSGIMSFGHSAFIGLGAYIWALLTMDRTAKTELLPTVPAWIADVHVALLPSIPLTMVAVGVLAAIVGLPLMRLPEFAVAIASFGVLMITLTVLDSAISITNGAAAFYGVPADIGEGRVVLLAVIALVGARLFRDTRVGLALRASRGDDAAARASGVRVPRDRLIAWTLSAMLASLAGVAYAGYLTVFSPSAFDFDATFVLIAMLVVGGRSSTTGAVVGAIALTAVTQIGQGLQDVLGSVFHVGLVGLAQIAGAAMLLLVLIFRSDGIAGSHEIDERLIGWARRKASRDT